eukprot:scaffold12921_cov87-Isochrysis_galbana.AAC.3
MRERSTSEEEEGASALKRYRCIFCVNKIVKRKAPGKLTRHARCAMTCNTEGRRTAVSEVEVATVVRNLDGIAMSGEMGNAGAMRMSRADSALLARAGEDHLGIGTHERGGDSGTPLELTLDDRLDKSMYFKFKKIFIKR